jgi:hypothetical protein
MNRENIKKVRDHIAGLPPEQFAMDAWTCGTCACIGGWTARLFLPPDELWSLSGVRRALGITSEDAERLFFWGGAGPTTVKWSDTTAGQAVRVLDHLMETGRVEWSILDPADAQP